MNLEQAQQLVVLAEDVEAQVLGEDAPVWTARLDARAAELKAASDVLLEAGDESSALRLVALSRYAQASGRVNEVRRLVEDVLDRVGGTSPSTALASAQLVRGELAFRQGDQAVAREATEAALATARAIGESLVEARAEMNLARVAFRDSDAPRIFDHATRMLALADGDVRTRCGAVHMLGWAEYTAGNLAGAIARFEENVALYRESGNLSGMTAELANLGDLAAEAGDLDRAGAYLRESLTLAVETGSRYLLPSLLASAAAIAGLRGNHAAMIDLAAAADRQYDAAGLSPDPGVGINDALRGAATAAIGSEQSEMLISRGRQRSLEEAVEFAHAILNERQ